MASLKATWNPIAAAPNPRSSQTLSLVDDKVYIFSGELQPRTPVSADIQTVSLSSAVTIPSANEIPSSIIKANETFPAPRVGSASATINEKIYVFGGRGGKEMVALEENGRVWVFDSSTSVWSFIDPAPGSPVPESRSFHTAASLDEVLYIHAGCPAKGRLGDLWAWKEEGGQGVWKECASAPGSPRGGTSLVGYGGKLWRMNGFDGKNEVGGELDEYDPNTNAWVSHSFPSDGVSGPSARSVCALLPVIVDSKTYIVTLFGERGPSDKGHEGAGQFWDDVWAYSPADGKWTKVETDVPGGVSGPRARGWFAAAPWDKKSIVIQGGLNDENERLGDLWVLSF